MYSYFFVRNTYIIFCIGFSYKQKEATTIKKYYKSLIIIGCSLYKEPLSLLHGKHFQMLGQSIVLYDATSPPFLTLALYRIQVAVQLFFVSRVKYLHTTHNCYVTVVFSAHADRLKLPWEMFMVGCILQNGMWFGDVDCPISDQ